MVSQIIKFEGKYGDTFYDASTPEAIAAAFTKELRLRDEQGWYQRFAEEAKLSAEEEEALALTETEVESLPESLKVGVRTKRVRAKQRQERARREQASENRWFDLLDKVLAHPADQPFLRANEKSDVSLAEALMQRRNGAEYEGYEFIDLEDPLADD